MKKTIVNLLTMAIVISAVMLSCKDESDDTPKVCTCPNGTLHLVGETCCNEVGCVCEKDVAGQRIEGIAVTKGEGVSDEDFDKMTKAVEDAFNEIEVEWNCATEAQIAKNNLTEIRIRPGPQTENISVIQENGRYILLVEQGYTFSDIANALWDFVEANPQLE